MEKALPEGTPEPLGTAVNEVTENGFSWVQASLRLGNLSIASRLAGSPPVSDRVSPR